MKILVVEDHLDVLDCLRSYFVQHEHDVLSATTAQEAIQLLQRETPDLALIDLKLPRGNGRMVIQDIVRRCRNPMPRMVVITADDNLELRKELIGYGVSDYLFKPITIRDLDDLIGRIQAQMATSFSEDRVAGEEGLSSLSPDSDEKSPTSDPSGTP